MTPHDPPAMAPGPQARAVMTIGTLARRTGVPVKTLREYEDLGLIYTVGRSPGNYRLFGEEALWCVGIVGTLRGLGLTLSEIQELAATTSVAWMSRSVRGWPGCWTRCASVPGPGSASLRRCCPGSSHTRQTMPTSCPAGPTSASTIPLRCAPALTLPPVGDRSLAR